MSAYTELHIVPLARAEWCPDAGVLEALFRHVGARMVETLSAFSRALLWEDVEKLFRRPLLLVHHVTVQDALEVWKTRQPRVCWFGLALSAWSGKLAEELDTIPADVRGDYSFNGIAMTAGPLSIPTFDFEGTQGRFCFQLGIGGYGMPYRRERYLELAGRCPSVAALLQRLRELAPDAGWGMLVSSSY